jgi:hypothetical protein
MDRIKWFWWLLIGAVLMFIILKTLSKANPNNSRTWQYSKQILSSQQFTNLSKTNEFRELIKLPATAKLLESVAADQLKTISQSLF